MEIFETNAFFIFVSKENGKFLAHEDKEACNYIEMCDWNDLTEEAIAELEQVFRAIKQTLYQKPTNQPTKL